MLLCLLVEFNDSRDLECCGRNCWRSENSKVWCKSGKRGQQWNDMHEVIMESEVNRWIESNASQSQMNEGPYSWILGFWAEIYIHSFSGHRLYKLFPALVYLHTLSFQIKPSQGGRDGVLHLGAWLCRVADWERGIWRRFNRQITAGPLRVVCLPSSSRASPTELLPCWLATLKTPNLGLNELCGEQAKIRRKMGEDWGETKSRRRKRKVQILGRGGEKSEEKGLFFCVKRTRSNTKSRFCFTCFHFIAFSVSPWCRTLQLSAFSLQWTRVNSARCRLPFIRFFFFSSIAYLPSTSSESLACFWTSLLHYKIVAGIVRLALCTAACDL